MNIYECKKVKEVKQQSFPDNGQMIQSLYTISKSNELFLTWEKADEALKVGETCYCAKGKSGNYYLQLGL